MGFERINEIVEVSEHLPSGASVVVHQLDWDDYERVLESLVERPGLRVSCDCGRLEIVSPLSRHGRYDRLIGDLVIQNAKRIVGKDIDLEADPPPDIVVEIDITSRSLHKLPIYAGLGIPEVWLYDGQTCQLYTLVNGRYVEATVSSSLPRLTGQMLADALELGKTQGQDAARKTFRRTLEALEK